MREPLYKLSLSFTDAHGNTCVMQGECGHLAGLNALHADLVSEIEVIVNVE
jgi:hypothetical protein